MSGWIKLHRKVKDNWIWDMPEPFCKRAAWVDILLMVNHEERTIDYKGGSLTLKPGQCLTSLDKLSARWGWSRNKVDRFFRKLERTQMCNTNRTSNGTVLTVENWAFYQGMRDSDERADGKADGKANEKQTRSKEVKKKEVSTLSAKTRSANELFEQVWVLYPEKKGKARVSDKDKRKLADIGLDQITRAIDRYKSEIESSDFKHYQHGSTFFHSGIYDYLDCSFEKSTENDIDQKREKDKPKPKTFEPAAGNAAAYSEFEVKESKAGVDNPFGRSVASEMLRRKREKVMAGGK